MEAGVRSPRAPLDAARLRGASLPELERIFVESTLEQPAPGGTLRGEHLGWVGSRGSERLRVRVLSGALFQALPWSIDFDEMRWVFPLHVRAGRFRIERGPSRWRDTEVLRMEYDVSRLPFRRILYDELKPLGPDLALGLGGLDAPRGEGDHFFFLLSR